MKGRTPGTNRVGSVSFWPVGGVGWGGGRGEGGSRRGASQQGRGRWPACVGRAGEETMVLPRAHTHRHTHRHTQGSHIHTGTHKHTHSPPLMCPPPPSPPHPPAARMSFGSSPPSAAAAAHAPPLGAAAQPTPAAAAAGGGPPPAPAPRPPPLPLLLLPLPHGSQAGTRAPPGPCGLWNEVACMVGPLVGQQVLAVVVEQLVADRGGTVMRGPVFESTEYVAWRAAVGFRG